MKLPEVRFKKIINNEWEKEFSIGVYPEDLIGELVGYFDQEFSEYAFDLDPKKLTPYIFNSRTGLLGRVEFEFTRFIKIHFLPDKPDVHKVYCIATPEFREFISKRIEPYCFAYRNTGYGIKFYHPESEEEYKFTLLTGKFSPDRGDKEGLVIIGESDRIYEVLEESILEFLQTNYPIFQSPEMIELFKEYYRNI